MIVVAALTRLLPHPPNFSPVEAMALFGGAYFASRRWAFFVPLVGMFISDLALAAINGGLYSTWFGSAGIWVVYLCVALTTALGLNLRGRVSGARVLGYSLVGSVLFFVVTNFASWAFQVTPTYPMTAPASAQPSSPASRSSSGRCWARCSTPALLFGGFALLRQRVPALRMQTV